MTDEVTDTDASEHPGDRDGDPPKPIILIASVGGSPQPIRSAIRDLRPAFVLFVASESVGDRPGSAAEVPAILEPVQAPSLPHDILTVPPDEPQTIFLRLRERIAQLRRTWPEARLVFDYTGGTKSMTGALFQCGIATPGAEVQFMLGDRRDLQKVADGTERPAPIAIEWLIAERVELSLRRAWASYDYASAKIGAEALLAEHRRDQTPQHAEHARKRLSLLKELSHAFDLWDRFQHDDAANELGRPLKRTEIRQDAMAARTLDEYRALAERCARSEPARLLDLVRNAERCAARGRYDDAVARLYRLVEWTAQWRLKAKHGIDSSNVDWSRFTEAELRTAKLEDQKSRSASHRKPNLGGLERTLSALRVKEPEGPLARWLCGTVPGTDKTGEHVLLRELIPIRNKSLLAHGEAPVTERAWEQWSKLCALWCDHVLFPLLRDAGEPAELPPQLPSDPAELGL